MNMRVQPILLLFFLCISYSAFSQSSSENNYDELLNLSFEEMMELDVVTTSKISAANIAEVPSVISVVTAEDIRNSGAKNMEEVLRTVAGFDVIRSGFSPNVAFGVRGLYSTDGTNNKVLFLINGHPFRSVYQGDANVFLGNYPVNDIEAVEIIRGPGSTLFGAGAFLAVINIKTRENAGKGTVAFAAGSFNTQELYASTSLQKKGLKLSLSGNYYMTEGAKLQLESDLASEVLQPFADMVGFEGPAGAAPGLLNYGRNTLNLNLNASLKNFYLLGGFMQSEDEPTIGVYESLSRDNSVKNSASFAELGYKLPLKGDKGEWVVKTYYDGFNTDSNVELWSAESAELFNYFTTFSYNYNPELSKEPTFYREGEALRYQTLSGNNTFGAETNFAFNHKNKIKLITGAMYEYSAQANVKTYANGNFFFADPMTVGGEDFIPFEAFGATKDVTADYNWNKEMDRQVFAAFGQAELNFTHLFNLKGAIHNLAMVAGGRFDHYSDAGGSFNPRAALLFSPTEKVYFKALYGQAFRAPSFGELYTQHSPVILGNADLAPETIRTIEGVAGFKPNKNSDVSLAYFNTLVNNNIQLVNTDIEQFVSVYTNIGNYRSSGVEADFRYTFKKAAYLFGTFTYQQITDITNAPVMAINEQDEQVQFIQEDFHPGRSPKFMANLGFNYPLHRHVNFNISGNFLGARARTEAKQWEIDEDTWRANGNIVPVDRREDIPARVLLNAAVRIHSLTFAKGFELQLSGFNLTDSENYNPTTIIRRADLQREGVNFMAKLQYTF